MYLSRKNAILLVGGVLATMLIVAPILFFVLRNDNSAQNKNTGVSDSQAVSDEQKPTRSQEEIRAEYAKNINGLLNLVNTSEDDAAAILSRVEAGFFDIFVPTDKKDLHIQTLLKIQKLKSADIDNKEKLREYIVPLLNALLEKTSS